MSSQPISTEVSANPQLTKISTGKSACATQSTGGSVLDEPWKITILPEEPQRAVRLVAAPEEQPARKSLPWKPGDVARLKDDSPEGMIRYIATHTTGWWQEMAERALRDTEKAERMAREAGWQPGQYWSLQVDPEAREKLLAAEEARRAREEAERAREEAEKEAFARRQMELLEKAGRAPRCEYVYSDGRGCRAPQVKGERWCHGHAKTMSYRPEKLELIPMEDENAVMVNLHRVTASLLSGRITEKTAGLMLWSAAIAAPGLKAMRRSRGIARNRNVIARNRKGKIHHGDTEALRSGDRKGKCKTFETRTKGVTGGQKGKPQMKTDEKKQLANSNWQLAKPKTCGTRRRGGVSTGGVKTVHAGVTTDKSFKSGVECQVLPGKRMSDRRDRENALGQHRHNRHSRDVSTPPRNASACLESLNMTKGRVRRSSSEHREGSIPSQSSVSPCLGGEKTTSNHKGHEGSGRSRS